MAWSDPSIAADHFPHSGSADKPAWPAVVALGFTIFGLVIAELLPASLITPMAAELGVSHGVAGQSVTAAAVIAALAGPVVVLGSGRVDRRTIVLAMTAILLVSSLLAAVATHIAVLLIARAMLGFAIGGFWAVMAAITLRLVPKAHIARAMAVIFSGVSMGTICAAPAGVLISDAWGWRATFQVSALIAVLALLLQLATLPKLPTAESKSLSSFAVILKRPAIMIGLATVLFAISGHFGGYTFIRPFLEEVPKLDVVTISALFFAFGVGGFVGNFVGGVVTTRSPALGAGSAALVLFIAAAMLILKGSSPAVAVVATTIWGVAFGGIPVALTTYTTQAAPDHAEAAGAVMGTVFQGAIALGALAGGILVDQTGPIGAIGYFAIGTAIGASLMLSLGLRTEHSRLT